MMHIKTREAYTIAQKALASCFVKEGIVAGPDHFVDLWARDSFFATFGLLEPRDYTIAKTTIHTFFRFQRADGLVPYRVMRSRSTIGKYLGRPSYIANATPNYRSHQSGGTVPDGGLLAVIAIRIYYDRSGDKRFLTANLRSLERAIQWYETRYKSGLIREWFLCEWADAVLKIGATLYTNVLYVKALNDMAYLSLKLGVKKTSRVYAAKAKKMYELLHNKLWNGIFFSDWYDYKRHDFFPSHANFLAIHFGLVSKKEARSILAYAKRHTVSSFTVETNHPRYPFWRIGIIQIAAGMRDYHNRGCMWLQPGIMYALSLWKLSKHKEARAFLSQVAAQIVKHNEVYEVYEKNGEPVRRLFYRSEGPFAWSAGLFLFAYARIMGRGNKN